LLFAESDTYVYIYIAACISPCLLFASLINFVNNIFIMLAGICFSRFSCGPPYKKLRLATCFFYYFFFLIANPQKRNPPKKKNPIQSNLLYNKVAIECGSAVGVDAGREPRLFSRFPFTFTVAFFDRLLFCFCFCVFVSLLLRFCFAGFAH